MGLFGSPGGHGSPRVVSGVHVALLRGINVGGKNKVEMARLKEGLEALGLTSVRTYINSGNIIFEDTGRGLEASDFEELIRRKFGLEVPVLVKDKDAMTGIADGIPEEWVNDSTMRCDVLFLWDDRASVLDDLPVREGIDAVRYVPGAVIWQVDRANLTRSGMPKLVGTDLYRAMTARNANTVRKLVELMRQT
jgi:uncharacterized protein (DUF1697 family)